MFRIAFDVYLRFCSCSFFKFYKFEKKISRLLKTLDNKCLMYRKFPAIIGNFALYYFSGLNDHGHLTE